MANHGKGEEHVPRNSTAKIEGGVQEQDTEDGVPIQSAYTVFSQRQLRHLRLLLGIATITSPLTATIYLPLLPLLRKHFQTSAQAINLTLTLYIVFQAISPALFGPLSDTHGRRPLFLLTLAVYVLGNVGLAINESSFVALLLLRSVQSLGASAAYAISFGVVADVCVPSDRGRMLGPISIALNLGTCVGPVVGGAVAYTSGTYHWVFWALVLVGSFLLLAVGLFLPETARSLVGNGDDPSLYKWWYLSGYSLIRRGLVPPTPPTGEQNTNFTANRSSRLSASTQKHTASSIMKGIFACVRVAFHKDTILSLFIHGAFFTVDYSFVAAMPDIYKDIYHWDELMVGLAYLPRGVGIIVGSFFTGKVMDLNYRETARSIGWTINKISGDDLLKFPIEKARSRGSYWLLLISTGTMIGYGWVVERRTHPSVALLLQFMQGFWGTYFYTTYSALMVDSFTESPSTAAAATSITRCAMAAAGVALLQPLLDAAGRGWYFTVLGLWSGIFGAASIALLRRYGWKWRKTRNSTT
ncbi:MFS general substrate transporter [Lophiostoma macrostomum CBS 122681]|uniref:MFS general substrate transporter n=1 Tax=Lophiostoma macrostomum CBS 122681 TaxID=1314788 RepID=A0A6A6SUA7_9PLEO|nr:MFS general substrate transporter [Lophiostoma macrostomum CBS 122681]